MWNNEEKKNHWEFSFQKSFLKYYKNLSIRVVSYQKASLRKSEYIPLGTIIVYYIEYTAQVCSAGEYKIPRERLLRSSGELQLTIIFVNVLATIQRYGLPLRCNKTEYRRINRCESDVHGILESNNSLYTYKYTERFPRFYYHGNNVGVLYYGIW